MFLSKLKQVRLFSLGCIISYTVQASQNRKAVSFAQNNGTIDVLGNVQECDMKPPSKVPRYKREGFTVKGKRFLELAKLAMDAFSKVKEQTCTVSKWKAFVLNELEPIVKQKAWGLAAIPKYYVNAAPSDLKEKMEWLEELIEEDIQKKKVKYGNKKNEDRDLMQKFRQQGLLDSYDWNKYDRMQKPMGVSFTQNHDIIDAVGNVHESEMKPPAEVPRYKRKGYTTKGKEFIKLATLALDSFSQVNTPECTVSQWKEYIHNVLEPIVKQKAWGLSGIPKYYTDVTPSDLKEKVALLEQSIRDNVTAKVTMHKGKKKRDRSLMQRFRQKGLLSDYDWDKYDNAQRKRRKKRSASKTDGSKN